MPDNHDIATVNRKGLLTKLSGSATDVLLGTGVFGSAPAGSFPSLAPDGSASAPSYSFSSDSDVGLYFIAADTLGIATGGAERWRIFNSSTISILQGPTPGASSNGAICIIQGAPGGATSGNGGQLQVLAGDAVTSGTGGSLFLAAGSGVGTNKAGGSTTVTTGAASGSASGGSLTVLCGPGGATGAGGNVSFTSGDGGATSGNSGSITFQTGVTTSGNTQAITFFSVSPLGTDKSSGSIVFRIGAATGTGTQGNCNFQNTAGGTTILRVNSTTAHLSFMGTSPTITAGGGTSPSIVGKDQAFTVTIGTGGIATTFTVTFANAFTNAPPAVANSDTDIVAFKVATTTTTVVVTATAPFTAGSKVHVLVGSWE